MSVRILFMAATSLLATGLLVAACGGGEKEAARPGGEEGTGAEVEVFLDEWSVVPSSSTVSAGAITFTAINQGSEEHELVIVKTDLAPDALPVVDGKVDEEAAGEDIGEIEEFAPGGEEQATFDLEPGSYVLFCNIVEEGEGGELESHYEQGMRAAFVVSE